jgi:hypothetical protein
MSSDQRSFGKDMATAKQIETAFHISQLPLKLILSEERREQQRQRMSGFRDSAMLYRLWELFGAIQDPLMQPHLSEEEKKALRGLLDIFHGLPWRVVPSHPHVSELEPDDISSLAPSAQRLLLLLEQRTKKPWWRRLFSK